MFADGTSNYFKGLILVFSYLIVAASFLVHMDPRSMQDKPWRRGLLIKSIVVFMFDFHDGVIFIAYYNNYGCRHIQFSVLIRREVE
ncbi:hypothetical protein HanPI659440_Chr10g0388451 [Helianthus annuus]|nr:hypothetical protein HanPI659440_Chr10g0388451 [Helianthus annuus]